MQEGASRLDLSCIPSIGTIAASQPGRKPLPCFRCRSSYAASWIDHVRIREAEKPEQITALSRTLLRWHFEEVLHRHVPSSRGTRERGQR